MPKIVLENISKSFGNRTLYRNVNLRIDSGEKVAVVGENGVGKTTLLNMIAGKEAAQQGVVRVSETMAHFDQFFPFPENVYVETYWNQLFRDILSIEDELRAKTVQIVQDPDNAYLLNEYGEIYMRFESRGGYSFLNEIQKFVHVFELENLMGKKCSALSGGEKQYIRLALSLFSSSDIVLLDEPCSFLDRQRKNWLIQYIQMSPKTIVYVSHDDEFLKSTATKIICIANKEVKTYYGSYESYLMERKKDAMRQLQRNRTSDQMAEKKRDTIQKKMDWMGKAENKHRHAVTIRRMQREIERLENCKTDFDEESYEYMYKESEEIPEKREEFFRAAGVLKQYGNRIILQNCSFQFFSDSRIVIVGENGCGKSTFLRILAEQEPVEKGIIQRNPKIRIGWVRQEYENDDQNTILQYCLKKSGRGIDEVEEALYRLFDEKKVEWDRRVRTLSGGERKRLEILISILTEANVLLLDEPTTYMDAYAVNRIIEMLHHFRGAVILVTHDLALTDLLRQESWQVWKIQDQTLSCP